MKNHTVEFALDLRLSEVAAEIAKLENAKAASGELVAYDLGQLVRLRDERRWLATLIAQIEGGS